MVPRPRRSSLRALAATLLFSLGGCADDGPGAAYRSYLNALSVADYPRAFALLDESSRRALAALPAPVAATESAPAVIDPDDFRARARRAADAVEAFRILVSGGKSGATPPLSPAAAAAAAASARLVESDDATAVLETETPLGLRRVSLRREGGAWRVVWRGL